jgi:hypothetical protein
MNLIFRSANGKRFDMGCLIMLGLDSHMNSDSQKHVISEIYEWTPEERWERFFGQDDEAKCVVFHYGGNVLSTGCIKMPHYDAEIFCFVDSEERTLQEIEEAAKSKFNGTSIYKVG